MPSDPLPDWVIARRRQIGDRVRAARTARQLSQEKPGELAGLSRAPGRRPVPQGSGRRQSSSASSKAATASFAAFSAPSRMPAAAGAFFVSKSLPL
ncbi:hypothetical protein GCM10010358_55800 [Streptomyces minutiscleroticus]|uniref:XRE family transcriptional regulator n=1 Tax=Streptomyces minutiscleroticus TaxID=68238 RepID=A0A918U5F3_9ACTN|nr:hypothetical protein GCM10010358_55800 [Streptomyces minutiscleroticus]